MTLNACIQVSVFPCCTYELCESVLLTFQYSGEQLKQLSEREQGCRSISPLIHWSLRVRDMSRGLTAAALRPSHSLSWTRPNGSQAGRAVTLQIPCKGYAILSPQKSHSSVNKMVWATGGRKGRVSEDEGNENMGEKERAQIEKKRTRSHKE